MATQDTRTLRATCLCGSARHEISLPQAVIPIPAAFCHCTSCRHMSGCLCLTSIPVLSDRDYRPTGELLEMLTGFEFSKNRITHYFCRTCGAHMLAHVLPRDRNKDLGRWFAMCGTLENAEGVYLPQHEYIADTIDGGIADAVLSANGTPIERWATHPGERQQLPLHWVSPNRSWSPPSASDRLHAHCKCRGVEFWVARPADGSRYVTKFCTCESCRLGNGMEWFVAAWVEMRADQISVDKDAHVAYQQGMDFGTLKTYISSPGVKRGFCATCGATVFLAREGSDMVRIAVGLLDAPEGAKAESWLDWSLDELQFTEGHLPLTKNLKLAFQESLKNSESELKSSHG